MKKLLICCSLFFIVSSYSFGQKNSDTKRDTTKGFDFFVNPGIYVGNKKNANYYRGYSSSAEVDYTNPNPNIFYILRNEHFRRDIRERIKNNHRGVVDDESAPWLDDISYMRYTANFSFGIGARYRFSKNLTIGVVVTQARMTAQGTAYLGIKIMETNSDNRLPYPLVGKERRTAFELTANYLFPTQGIVSPFLEGGLHVNNTKVVSADLIVEEHPFSMINPYGQEYDPFMPQTKLDRKLGGVGYGFSAALGLRISFTKWAALEPAAQFRLEKVNLEGYSNITPNYLFMIRLVVGDRIFAKTSGE
ncbi:MAG: hypothetical protein FWH36_05645 [Lentimicrobiaceae bacterium]|nr:hypothetical protein [Lentimicrobiaceae bacterium]